MIASLYVINIGSLFILAISKHFFVVFMFGKKIFFVTPTEATEVFRVKKPNHSKKIVKQLKKEYKEDLEKGGSGKQESKTGTHLSKCCFMSFLLCLSFLFFLACVHLSQHSKLRCNIAFVIYFVLNRYNYFTFPIWTECRA